MKRIWKRVGIGILIYLGLFFATAGALIGFGRVSQPKALKSVTDPFSHMDLSDLPSITRYKARDGSDLSYRMYPGGDQQAAVLIHGSAGSSTDMHQMAKALSQKGVTVYVPDLRGHGANFPHGDIHYLGQLDDDMTDLMRAIRPQHKDARWTLVGFSSGGGFSLRMAGSPEANDFDRFIFISPFLRYNAPTVRPSGSAKTASPQDNAWYSVSIKRIIGISIMNSFGIHCWDGLPVLAFPVPSDIEATTATYSFRLQKNFAPHDDYRGDIRAISKPAMVFVGGDDELFLPEKFSEVFDRTRSDIPVRIVPGMGHSDMITRLQPIAAVVDTFLQP